MEPGSRRRQAQLAPMTLEQRAIAIAAALLGLLTVLLPRDRKHQSEGKARLQAASAQCR
jgi:hypothetical protein